jgi:NTP pyrophosphatase (non-canonical NTP hydrolase)
MAANMMIEKETGLVTLQEYQEFTRLTDQNKKKDYAGLMLPLLGIYGEVGSLLSELKKKQRDAGSYVGYADSVVEELGDVMWYFTNIAGRAGLSVETLSKRISREMHDWDEEGSHDIVIFDDIQTRREHKGPTSGEKFEHGAIALASKVGRLIDDVSMGRVESNRDVLSADMVEILRAIVQAADDADISLQEAVQRNMEKVQSRWPIERKYPPLFDDSYDPDEQLPRRIEMSIAEKFVGGRAFVTQKCGNIKIGDRLTDNKAEQDDYRFHDVFHLAYAAILGWSPVTRALLKLKRKSNPKVDETDDGARAILIEEGVATWIFNHAVRLDYFSDIKALDYSLLKAVRELVKGYEVETRPMWLWEEAILEGFKVFRFLRENRKGLVVADLSQRKISVRHV